MSGLISSLIFNQINNPREDKMKYLKKLTVTMVSCLLFTIPTSAFADAFEGLSMMRMGAWEVDFSGNVNAFATIGECDPQFAGTLVGGGLACLGNANDEDYTDVRDGLLPSWFNFTAATVTDSGIRTAVHISFQPGTDTGSGLTSGLDGALGQGSTNFRQVFLTFGTEQWGTIKLGRDLGVFGSDAILEDMTLLGVGSGAHGRGHTTLGRIGVGYLYADWKPQVQYTSPNMNGFTFTGAIVDPWGASSLAGSVDMMGNNSSDPTLTRPQVLALQVDDVDYSRNDARQEKDTYGIEAKLNYSYELGDTSARFWAGYIRQDLDFTDDPNTAADEGNDAEADGYEFGAKWGFGGFDVVGYYYDGEGIGTTGFLLDGLDRNGNERDSDGFYIQGRYRMPTGTLLGISYGESSLDETALDRQTRERDEARINTARMGGATGDALAPRYNLVDTNESVVVGLYHPIGEALNLVLEYTDTEAEAHSGITNEEKTLAIGAIMFF